MIVIKYTGWVPKPCDCTRSDESPNQEENEFLTFDNNKHGHGVTHHGSDYEITTEQRHAIESFRSVDMELYNLVVKEIFEKQVQEVEKEYNVKLCNKLKAQRIGGESIL